MWCNVVDLAPLQRGWRSKNEQRKMAIVNPGVVADWFHVFQEQTRILSVAIESLQTLRTVRFDAYHADAVIRCNRG